MATYDLSICTYGGLCYSRVAMYLLTHTVAGIRTLGFDLLDFAICIEIVRPRQQTIEVELEQLKWTLK